MVRETSHSAKRGEMPEIAVKKLYSCVALLGLALAGCASAPATRPTPPSTPVQTSRPVPTPPPVATQPDYANWLDAPQTPGDWSYRDGSGLSFATFGQSGTAAVFGIECQKASRTIRLVRGTSLAGPVPLRFRTETAERLVTANSQPDGRPMLFATVQARDPLLDAIALSRGRFAVETAGLDTLYLPAWPEISRVIEDCR